MAQDGTTAGGSSYTIDNVTFPVGRTKLQSIFDAIRSTNIGNTAPDLVAGQFWIDNNTPSTTVWTLYLYDGTDNISFATIDTINNTVNFLDSTFDLINDSTPELGGDLSSNGNNINFGDNDKAQFGAGNDLQIYHDGSFSRIKDLGTGALILDTDGTDVRITKTDTEFMAKFNVDSHVGLYYDNSEKFQTTSTGALILGRLSTSAGNASEPNFNFSADGNTGIFRASQDVIAFSNNGSESVRIDSSGNVGFKTTNIDNNASYTTLRLGTTGGIWAYTPTSNGNLYISENISKQGGTRIRGDFATSYRQGDGNHQWYNAPSGSAGSTVTLSERMRITSDGSIGIGTTAPARKLTLYDDTNSYFAIQNSTSGTGTSSGFQLQIFSDDAYVWNYESAGNMHFGTSGEFRQTIASNGDISFYEDTGTTPKFYWDASNEKLGIGQSNPTMGQINLETTGNFTTAFTDPTATCISMYSTGTAGDGNYGAGIAWGALGGVNSHQAAISSVQTGSDANQVGLSFFTHNSTVGSDPMIERMRITSSGHVGINTTASVSGLENFSQLTISGGEGGIVINSNDTGVNDYGRLIFTIGNSTGNEGLIRYNTNDYHMSFWTNATERMRIEANGNVGIGTSSPAHNLEIVATNSGSINDSLQIRNNSGDTGSGSRIRFITSNDKNSDTNGASLGTVRNGNDNAMFFETENAERMRIDTNGKVGIGTTSPQEQVDISSSAPRIRFSDTSVTGLHHKIGSEANDFEISCDTGNDQADSHIGFKIDGSERMRIDSSGNLLVGKTSDGSAVSTEGINLRPFTTPSTFTRDGGTALQIARLTSDGSLIKFYKDGTLIGEIGTRSDKLHIGNGDTGLEFHGNDDTIYPTNPTTGSLRDNSIDFGSNLYRFKDLYLSGGLYVGGTGTANKLDDYEEGTWTPTANSGLSGFAVTIAKYTKIGNLVTVMTYLTSITGKNASILTIGGLPFNYGTNLFQPAVADLQNKMRWVRTGSNSDTLNFYNEDRTSVVGNDVGTHIILNITYQIS